MTPDHEFQLLLAAITVVPATIVSAWALISQLRQTKPRLQVLTSPITTLTIEGKRVLTENWPGVVVRNFSPFPIRICNVGFTIGKKRFYQFGTPLNSKFEEMSWPCEIEPRQRLVFYVNEDSLDGRQFINAIPKDVRQDIWRLGLGYAMTECGNTFFSKPISRKSVQVLQPKPRPIEAA